MKPRVAFICVHNSCRSQIAEAIAKIKASEVMDVYSAGTEKQNSINQDAVRLIKNKYHVDMNDTQSSKTIDVLPPIDIVITMGCNVDCPWLPAKHREDWGLDDPSGQSDFIFENVITQIEEKLNDLVHRIQRGIIDLWTDNS